MYSMTNEEFNSLPMMKKPYAYDAYTETAFSKKAYKRWMKKGDNNE